MLPMNEYEKIKQTWREQPIAEPSELDFKALKNRIGQIARNQKITNVILLATAGVLMYFFYFIEAIAFKKVALALGAMIGVLLIRVAVELFSIYTLKRLSETLNFTDFNEKLSKYYKKRIGVHLVLTPIAILIYCYSFWTLLPSFEASLSKGFYHYIVISSLVVLVVLGVLIFTQVRKEIRILKDLKND